MEGSGSKALVNTVRFWGFFMMKTENSKRIFEFRPHLVIFFFFLKRMITLFDAPKMGLRTAGLGVRDCPDSYH